MLKDMDVLDESIAKDLSSQLKHLEDYFEADVVSFYGEIHPSVEKRFRDFIEITKGKSDSHNRVVIILNTPGGSVETTEKLVLITRHHYKEVYFVVPDYAMSAGTIWCMSGDKIYMDYSSSLGPIDPQVFNGKSYVPALGYLDKVTEMISKSKGGGLSFAEIIMLRELDLGRLRSYEQARDLTISLLEEWLVKYKFKNWKLHRTNPDKIGKKVTKKEKEQVAREIGEMLNRTDLWHSHGRSLSIDILRKVIKLEIEDYSNDINIRSRIRTYNDMLIGYILRNGIKFFLHSCNHF